MNFQNINRDWQRNHGSIKSLIIVFSYRISSYFAQHPNVLIRFLGLPARLVYKLVIEMVLGVELPDRVISGPGLAVFHGIGLVVNARTILGQEVTLRQNTTIGVSKSGGRPPRIGDGVTVGSNCVIIGDIDVGSHSIIGAGAILTKSCPPNSIVRSSHASIISPDA